MLIEAKERAQKRELAVLKEKISHFLYRKFIEFERDLTVKIADDQFIISFYIPKYKIVIDVLANATAESEEYQRRYQAYKSDNVRFLILDNAKLKEVDTYLEEELPKLGCHF